MTDGVIEERVGDRGEPAVRTLAMPADTNPSGDIFGGWVLAQMDLAAGIVAAQRSKGRVATVALDGMSFHRTVLVDTFVLRASTGEEVMVTEGRFTLVAIDDDGRPRPVPPQA